MKSGSTIQLDYNGGEWIAVFSITDSKKAAEAARASLAFFGDPITSEDDSDGEALKACLKMYGRTMVFHSMNGGVDHVREKMAKEEGYFPLDGSQGIKLEECESWDFLIDYFDVCEEDEKE